MDVIIGGKGIISSTFKLQTKSLRIMWNKWNISKSNLSLTEYIADHIPPSKLNRRKRQNMKNKNKKQILLPQCQDCSSKQSQSVKQNKRTLMIHNLSKNMTLWHLWMPFPWIFNYLF